MLIVNNKRNNLRKIDIAKKISTDIGIPSSYSAKIVTDIINILLSTLISNKKLKIKNFGIFTLLKKKKKTGRNPKNNKQYDISERAVVTFRSSKNLKKIV